MPGLAAKPFIDCGLLVAAEDVDAASAELLSLGYPMRRPLGLIPMRWVFLEPERLD